MELFAHLYGVPIEEMLMPLGGVSVAVLTASAAHRLHQVRKTLAGNVDESDGVRPDSPVLTAEEPVEIVDAEIEAEELESPP